MGLYPYFSELVHRPIYFTFDDPWLPYIVKWNSMNESTDTESAEAMMECSMDSGSIAHTQSSPVRLFRQALSFSLQ